MKDPTRRSVLVGASALVGAAAASAFVGSAAAQEPVFDDTKPTIGIAIPSAERLDEIAAAPEIMMSTVKLWTKAPVIGRPNAMQFTQEGTLLLLDQADPNKVFEVKPEDGSIIRSVQTESMGGSGICVDDEGKWIIASTKALASGGVPVTLRVEPSSGATIDKWVTPGWGFYGRERTAEPGAPPRTPSGGHDVKWAGGGRYWLAVPASGRIFLMDAKTGKPVRSIPSPINRSHGLAVEGSNLWVAASDFRQILRLDPMTGKVLAKVQLGNDDPGLHGLEIQNGTLWYCDSVTGYVCKLV